MAHFNRSNNSRTIIKTETIENTEKRGDYLFYIIPLKKIKFSKK